MRVSSNLGILIIIYDDGCSYTLIIYRETSSFLMNHSLCLHVSAMAVLELLTATAWAWIVRTRHALCTVWSAVYFCVLASILVAAAS